METLRSLNNRMGAFLLHQQIPDTGTDFPPLGTEYLDDLLELGIRATEEKEQARWNQGADEYT